MEKLDNNYITKHIKKYKEYVAGGVSGIIRIMFGYPIETIKVRMQTTGVKNNNLLNIKSLYKGSFGVFSASFITTSIEFGAYDFAKKRVDKCNNIDNKTTNLITNAFISGVYAGLCQLPITTPVELIRNRLQTVSNSTNLGKFSSLNLYWNILNSHGIKALYKGTYVTGARDGIGTGLYFTSYELTKKKLKDNEINENGYFAQSVGGIMAGLGFWLPIYPLDVIKNNIQIDDFNKPKFKNYSHCIRHIYMTNGIIGFYRGFSPCMIRSIPVHIGIFSSYKYVMDNFK